MFRRSDISIAIMVATVAISAVQMIAGQEQVPERTLVGVWEVTTTPRDCTSGEPIPAATFVSIHTFNQDGTMISTSSSGTPLPFHGLWRRELGWRDHSLKRIRILRSPVTNLYSGKQVIGSTIVLSESGNEYTADEWMIVYSVDGVPTTPACINSVGTRFRLD